LSWSFDVLSYQGIFSLHATLADRPEDGEARESEEFSKTELKL
jgi:hypothetical protein